MLYGEDSAPILLTLDEVNEKVNELYSNELISGIKKYLRPFIKDQLIKDIKNIYENKINNKTQTYLNDLETALKNFEIGTTTQPSSGVKTEVVIPGVEIKRNAITKEEQLELFNILKPYIEQQGAKTNKATSANVMIGLGLRWDYKSNNPNYKSIEIKNIIVPGSSAKYGYYEVSINGQPLGPINPRIKTLMSKATGIDATDYDGAIINLYTDKTFISAHNDVDEAADAIGYPVLVLNIGGSGNFSVQQTGKYEPTPLNSGDSYVFGINGENRKVMHRTFPSKQDGFLPAITTAIDGETYSEGSYRLSITLRRVKNLEPGMPTVPAKITTQPSTDNLNAPDGLPGIPRTSTDCQ
jgi:alkylated DNA repair dioxygenase AlkB